MIGEIIAIYSIVEDLLKATGHQEDCRIQMSDAEVIIRNPILIPTLYVKENLTNDNELNF